MRQHRSLFCLFARHSFWQVLLTLAVCGVVQWLVFLFQLRQADSLYGALLQCTAFFSVILFLGFGVVSAVLLFATTGLGKHKPAYTMARLSLSPGWVLAWQGIYNTLVYLLFWWVQALVLMGLCWFYGWQGGFLGDNTLYLTLWQVPLFHTLLPLGISGGWAKGLCLCIGLGVTGACFTAGLRRDHRNISFFVLAGSALLFADSGSALLIVISVTCVAGDLVSAWQSRKEARHEEMEDL